MKLRLKGFCRWSLALAIGLFVFTVLFAVEENVRGRILLRRWVERMQKSGEHLRLAEILPATPKPEDNAAPYIAPFPVGLVIPGSVPTAMRYVAPGTCAVVPWQQQWYYGGNWNVQFTTNGFRSPLARGRRVIPPTNGAPYSIATAADLVADLATASNAMASLKIGLRRSGFDFAVNYEMGLNTPITHLAPLKSTANWLRAASLCALMQTNHAESLEHLQDLMRFVRLQTNGVLLIEHLVRLSVLQIAASATWEALQVDGWNDEQLEALQEAWRATEFSPWLGRASNAEQIMGGDEVERIADLGMDRLFGFVAPMAPPVAAPSVNSVPDFFDMLSHVPDKIGPAFMRGVYFPFWRFAWKDQDKLHLYRTWEPAIEAIRKQYANPNWRAHSAQMTGHSDDWPFLEQPPLVDPRYLVSRVLGGMPGQSVRRAVDAEATQALVVTAVAVQRWKLAHKNFPQRLDELVPALLPKLPVDPFDGQPLRYRAGTNASFTLYSVGHNFRDDGGDARPEKGGGMRPNFLNALDIVWPSPATREEIETFERKEAR
jgi:hypothetical protein